MKNVTWMKNCWYVAARDNEINCDGLLARTICGTRLVFYRTENGDPVAMHDSCPHRLVPLSRGRLVGDSLQCAYHGMRFSPEGVCTKVPGQTDIPSAACVKTFPVVDKYNLTWVWVGDPSLADEGLVPHLPWCSSAGWDCVTGYLHFGCDFRLINDNLLDLSHESYIHLKTIGNEEEESIADFPAKTDVISDRLVRVHREMPDIVAPPFFAHLLGQEGMINRWQSAIHLPPGINMTNVGFYPCETPRKSARQFVGLHLITPETETTSHYFWVVSRQFRQGESELSGAMEKGVYATFHEDKELLEMQQMMINESPEQNIPKVATRLDAGPIRARRLLQTLIEKENSENIAIPPIQLAPEGPLNEEGNLLVSIE